ncbi:XK-related protein 8-like [Pangasianodon hypophthalmus]|uniref:XK-related protein 8-like n=1 Tax=Pangasianodon hypophthalmus TaxID=310915 RepID=UPI000EFE90B6|nr:XK-related protein 8-like [Pangasianodon hypophthalmus]
MYKRGFAFISCSKALLSFSENIQAHAMEEGFPFNFALSDVFFSLISLLLFLMDVVLDLWAIVSLYEEQKYFSMGLLIFLLLSSSVLLQIFSWIWYSESSKNLETKVERFISRHGLLAPVHICQLGVFLRFAAVMEISSRSFKQSDLFPKGVTVYLNHDLSMLRLFEAFSESAPQLVLMMALIMEMQEMQSFTVIKIVGSLSSLSFTVLSYHRSMRAFVPEKLKMGWSSSIIYFLWNLFLIGPRVVSVSLFASVLPCYIAAHFLSLWTLLVLWSWWQKTDFMDTKAGEWLYRATVGLIWYFTWFNVASGRTKLKGIIYHMVMGADMMLLLGLWWWRRSVESARLSPLPINPYLLIVMLMIIYIIGVLLKLVYYWKFHPKQPELQIKVAVKDEKPVKLQTPKNSLRNNMCSLVETDSIEPLDLNAAPEPHVTVTPPTQTIVTGVHKRMKNTAVNFYF